MGRGKVNTKGSKKKSGTDRDFLAADSDDGINFSDIPMLGREFWKKAAARMPEKKDSVPLSAIQVRGSRLARGGR